MKIKIILLALALGVSTCFLTAQDPSPSPSGQRPQGREGAPRQGGFHVLPPRALQQLNLTADQQKQVADLEAEVKAKIEQILTPEQLEQLKQMRPPQRPGGPGGNRPNENGACPGGPQSSGTTGSPQRQPPPSE